MKFHYMHLTVLFQCVCVNEGNHEWFFFNFQLKVQILPTVSDSRFD